MNIKMPYVSVLLLFGILVCWFGWQQIKLQSAGFFPVKFVRIMGEFQYITMEQVKAALQNKVKNGFIDVDLQEIDQALVNLPWVNSVEVKREWPDTIDIIIIEQTPVARWGKNHLMNEKAELFKPGNIKKFMDLPVVYGGSGNEAKLLKIMKGLQVSFLQQNMRLGELSVSDRGAWVIKLKRGIELILGRKEPLKNLNRFFSSIHLIGQEQIEKIATVDLRYPNGYAISWLDSIDEIDWKKIEEQQKIKTF